MKPSSSFNWGAARRVWAPYLVLITSLLTTLIASHYARSAADAKDRLRFQNSVQRLQSSIQNRLETYIALLRAGSGLFAASDQISRAEFQVFVDRLNLQKRYPGIQGVGFSICVRPQERAALVAKLAREGAPDFKIWPDHERAEYHSIIYLEPQDVRNQAAVGFDMFTEPTRRAAMEHARDTGAASASGKVTLVQEIDDQKQAGFLIYVPVYRKGVMPASEAERRESLLGFVYSPFRADDLLVEIMGAENQAGVDFQVFDGEMPAAENLLHQSSRDGWPPGGVSDPNFTAAATIDVAGRAWGLRFATRPEFESASGKGAIPFLFLGGIGISLLLFGITSAQVSARTAAEASERRSAFLAEASALLAGSLDYELTLAKLARLVVPGLADWCIVDMLEEDRAIRRVAVAHTDPGKVKLLEEMRRRYPLRLDRPHTITNVLRTGEAQIIPKLTAPDLEAAAEDAEHLVMLRKLELRSVMCVPLQARGRTLGALSFAAAKPGRYGQDDLGLAEDLARRAGLAVDNARLYREAQEAVREREEALARLGREEQQMALLAEASGTVVGSLKLSELLPAIFDLSHRLIAAEAYAVWRFDPAAGQWQIVSAAGLSERYQRAAVEAYRERGGADLTMAPAAIEDVRESPLTAADLAAYEQEGIEALLMVPLRVQGQAAGSITFYYHQPRAFSETEIRVATALGNLAAAAIGSAELYEEQRRLRAEAQEANRLKDEFLATVSHELRTPLNAILGWAHLLRTHQTDETTAAQALATIERNARAQAQLINDLLDASRIITGKLRLEVHPIELQAVIEDAIATIRPAADAKGIEVQTALDPGVGPVPADPARLQQVVWNLLSNAVKFTPQGGRVSIRLGRVDSQVEINVSDTGKGISTEFLPYVFDRFRQADSSITRAHGGLGLGLAIVRHLIELHGGTVEARSPGEGQGASFTVMLPLSARAE